jgi:hypothetical protein
MRGHEASHPTTLLLCALMLIPALVQAQGMCVPEEITVAEVKGQVYFGYEGKRRVQRDVVVQVVSQRENRVLAETTTDSEGLFSIKGIRAGRYWLRTRHTQIIGIEAELVVTSKPPKSKARAPQIVFVLGADPSKSCGGGKVELVGSENPSRTPGHTRRI